MCVDRWTEDNGKKGVSVAVFSCCAGRLRYVGSATCLCSYAAHPCPVTVRRHDSTATTIEARKDIIAYRRSGLVQRRALLRVGRRIAPCLLCVDACAMCHSRRYALGRGTGAALVNRYCATHHDCHHTGRHSAIPLCQHSAPHVHFAPTPDC